MQLSAALSDQQRAVLAQRGVLDPTEIHRLASKTKQAVHALSGTKAACHSDASDDDEARRIQERQLVQLGRKPLPLS